MYCNQKSKAIITLNFKNDAKEIIISNHPGVEISLNQTGNQKTKKVYLRGLAFSGGKECTPIPVYEEYQGEIAVNIQPTVTQGRGGTCDNGTSRTHYIPQIGSYDSGTEWRVGTVTIREEYSPAECKIEIKDRQGIIYSRTINDVCPNHTIACDDQCPEGQERIEIVEYPGYKCREKCPPETICQCDCGDVICCYGSNGQVIKSIKK